MNLSIFLFLLMIGTEPMIRQMHPNVNAKTMKSLYSMLYEKRTFLPKNKSIIAIMYVRYLLIILFLSYYSFNNYLKLEIY